MESAESYLPPDFLPLLDEINRIVLASGAPLEGNLFYAHHEPAPGRNNFLGYFHDKRRNYLTVCHNASCALEIGVNGGHSALMALSSGVEYHGVDICAHPYTRPVVDFLKKTFGERFHFYEGDSLKVLPEIRIQKPSLRFDFAHIDGYHTLEHCTKDTHNALELMIKNGWILIDDTDMDHIRQFYEAEIGAGRILANHPAGWTDHPSHGIGSAA